MAIADDGAGGRLGGDCEQQAEASVGAQSVLRSRRCFGGGIGFALQIGRPEGRAEVAGTATVLRVRETGVKGEIPRTDVKDVAVLCA